MNISDGTDTVCPFEFFPPKTQNKQRNRVVFAVFSTLADSGIAVYSGDAIGHGKSGGERAYIQQLDHLVTDFTSLCDTSREECFKEYGQTPMFIGGHSLGGLVASRACLVHQSQWNGLLLSSPLLDVEWTMTLRIQAAFSSMLAATVPKLRMVPKVVAAHMNRDPEKVKEYENDDLVYHSNLPVRSGSEMLKGFKSFEKEKKEFVLPIYAHHGTADKVTSFQATKAFVDGSSSTDTTFIPVEGGYHEVLFEDCGDDVLRGMIDWMLQHTSDSSKM